MSVPLPNGTDDTEAMQLALDQCVSHGAGCTVQLAAGTYLTEQLFAKDFHGIFKGKFAGETRLTALWGVLEFMSQSEKMNVLVTRVALKGAYDGTGSLFGYNASACPPREGRRVRGAGPRSGDAHRGTGPEAARKGSRRTGAPRRPVRTRAS